MPKLAERIEGGIIGLLVGDALGVPYEFKSPAELPEIAAIEMDPPPGFGRTHPGVPAGTWSDDGAQALCLLESLLERGRLEPDDFAARMVRWYRSGHLAVDGRVFDVGLQTAETLRAIAAGTPPLSAARRDEHGNGNGALMRVLPLALIAAATNQSDADLVRDARLSSEVTHGHLRSQLCCALYCLWVRRLCDGVRATDAWLEANTALLALVSNDAAARKELEQKIRPDADADRPGSGYVVDTLRSARALVGRGGFEQVVKHAVLLGYDTDTTAAVAGGAAGVRDGIAGIPQRWRAALRGCELVAPLLEQLLGRVVRDSQRPE